LKGIWEEVVSLPLRPPLIRYKPEYNRHTYYPWEHQITFSSKPDKTPAVHLLHELAHAWIAGLGIVPFVETHGPFFLAKFGQMWSLYSAKSYQTWERRCQGKALRFSNQLPNLSSYRWALAKEGGRSLAVRPAQRAAQLGWNIENTFELIEKHPWKTT